MRRTLSALALLPALLALLLVSPVRAEDAADSAAEAPKTVVVTRRPFVQRLDVAGHLVPDGAVAVAYKPKAYGGKLKVVEAAGPGAVVAGQLLVRFDEEPLRKELKARERDLYVARASLEKQEAELRQKRALADIARRQEEEKLARAEEALRHWVEVERPRKIAEAKYGMQGRINRLQDDTEEFEQLEKMYGADDLTEETEEIVLRRTRRNLARSRTSFEWAVQKHERFLAVTMPREDMDREIALEKVRIQVRTSRITLASDVRRSELDFEKAKDAFETKERSLADLRADRDALRVRAPVDGYAVPGAFKGTSWGDIDGMRVSLRPGSSLKAHQVLFTVVRPGDVDVRISVAESDVLKVKGGQRVTVKAPVLGGRAFAGVVSEVLPVASGTKYTVAIDLQETDPALMPGQTCKTSIEIRRVEDALVLPAGAVQGKGTAAKVWVYADGKTQEQQVRIGGTDAGHVLVLEGVEAGTRVLARPPEAAK